MISNKGGWTEAEDALIRAGHRKLSAAELAIKLGEPAVSVRRRAVRLGVWLLRSKRSSIPPARNKKLKKGGAGKSRSRAPSHHVRWTEREDRKLARLLKRGTCKDAAAALGRTPSACYRRAGQLGLSGDSSISREARDFIRRKLLRLGVSETARQLNISTRTVRRELARQGLLDVGGMTLRQERLLRAYNPNRPVAPLARELGWTEFRTLRNWTRLMDFDARAGESRRD